MTFIMAKNYEGAGTSTITMASGRWFSMWATLKVEAFGCVERVIPEGRRAVGVELRSGQELHGEV